MKIGWKQRWRQFQRAGWLALGLLAAIVQAQASDKVVVYAAVGPELTQYDVDVKGAALTKRGSVTLPASVQEAWFHPSRKFIYVAWSNGVDRDHHGVTMFRIDPASGALSQGNEVALPARPINLSTDITGTHLLIAYNHPSGLTEHRIGADGSVGPPMELSPKMDFGIYAHQVRVDPSNKMVILVTRGNAPSGSKKEDPGALKVFSYQDGVLTERESIAPGGGFGFQARHLDFLPSSPFIYLSLEKQNKLEVYKKLGDAKLSNAPLFSKESLPDPAMVVSNQVAGTVHAHPNGRFVYQANRTILTENEADAARGENSIAVYSINQQTGEPTRIQNLDTRGITPRTFALDPSGSLMVVANQNEIHVPDGDHLKKIPASLAMFRIGGDGKLDFVRKYDVATGKGNDNSLWWMGLLSLP